MKIAITGASGIGKTTMALGLSKALHLTVIPEDFIEMTNLRSLVIQSKRAADHVKYGTLLERYVDSCRGWIKARNKYLQGDSPAIFDRCSFDVLKDWLTLDLNEDDGALLKSLINECILESEKYDLVIVPPIGRFAAEEINEAGLKRTRGLSVKINSQSWIIGLLEQFCAAPRLLINDRCETTEQRVELVCDTLRQLGKL
jgi:hypothetical protein